jgi:hypothetical protein
MAKIISFFFQLTLQIKLYHFQTLSFARHKASDELHTKMLELSDKFVEVFIAKYGRPKLHEPNNTIKIQNLSDTQMIHYLKKTIGFLQNDIPKHINIELDTDLVNIRDELLMNVNQALYLFTLE